MSKLQQNLSELHKNYNEALDIVKSCTKSLDMSRKTEIDVDYVHVEFHKLLKALDILHVNNYKFFNILIGLPHETNEEILERLPRELKPEGQKINV